MIVGYAVLYNFPGIIHRRGTSYEELIQVGCFAKSVQRGTYRRGKPIFACVNHRARRRLGNTEDGRLRLFEDSRGVGFELDAELPAGFRGMSFGFVAKHGGEWGPEAST